ncbi:MAG: H-X9-DG-CTERM domain-containing protein [Pirellulales bacterium]
MSYPPCVELPAHAPSPPASSPPPLRAACSLRGAKWINGHYGDALYNHYYVPNWHEWDCGNKFHNKALTAARSNHPGGVMVLFCDGHVQFVAQTIELHVWRAISTRWRADLVTGL